MKRTICTAARAAIAQIACVALLGLVPGLRLHAADFKFTQIDHPNALATEALGINDQGANFTHPNARAGQYNYTRIDVPGAVFTGLYGINSRGQTVGEYVDGSGTSHGFVRNVYGSIVTIDYPGAVFTISNGINSQGDVVGRWDGTRPQQQWPDCWQIHRLGRHGLQGYL